MGANGDITMSNLKVATGIADNRLSAHHPNGAGNQTAFGDFLVGVVGRRVASSVYVTASAHDAPPAPFDGWDTAISIPNCGDPNGTIIDGVTPSRPRNLTGSIDTADGHFRVDGSERFEKGDKFWIRIDTNADDSLGKHVAEQIGKNANSLIFQSGSANIANVTGNREVGKDGAGNYVIDIELEVTSAASVGAGVGAPFRYVDGMNTDAANYGDPSTQTGVDNTNLQFFSPDVETDLVYIRQLTSSYAENGSLYDMTIKAWAHDPADKWGTLYMWSYFEDSSTCPPNGTSVAMNRSGDDQFAERTITQSLLPDNTFQWRVVITKNSNPSVAGDFLDEETIDLFVNSSNSTGTTTNSVAGGDYTRQQDMIIC